jgi:predicted Ser/Thr protein kinase
MHSDKDIKWVRLERLACAKCGAHMDVATLEPFSLIACPSCGAEQTVPAQLAHFLLVERLGSGGMGAVYRAMDPTLGRFVAIKVMKAEMGDDPALVEGFLREARAAAALNHPNIVQIYSCGQEEGQPYIVMELVSGGRLDQLMANGRKVDEIRLLEIALDVAEGLKAANEAGLVHGDIKPANILLDKTGRARIVDFGLAMFVNRQQEQGGIWGTPYYISPERARGGKADHRSDIYSLGATMFHALAGRPPFDGKTAAEVVVARLKKPPPNLREIEPSVQSGTAELIERMMAADPALRYPTSASLLADMRHALVQAREARSPTARAKKLKKRDWSHAIVGGLAGVILLVVIILVYRWFSKAAEEQKIARTSPAVRPSAPARAAATGEAAAASADDAEGMTIQRSEGGRIRLSVTFFTGDLEASLVRACEHLAEQPGRMFEELATLAGNVPANSGRMMWLRVFQALPLWAQGDAARADELLRQVAALPLSQPRDHPVYMPQTLALYLIGDMSEERFAAARRGWPVWYADLAGFFQGLKKMFAGDADSAAPLFETYAGSERSEPAWAYALRPAARRWLDLLVKWEEIERDALSQAVAGDVAGARQTLDRYLGDVPAFMRAPADRVRAQIAAKEEEAREARRAEEERARRALVQRDLDAIDAWLAERTPVVLREKDYRRLSNETRDLAASLKTDEGRAQAAILREQFDRMNELKNLLGRELGNMPYRRADRELGGEAIGATALGLRVTVPGRGVVTRPWDQVTPRLFVALLRHLAENVYRPDDAKADLYLSMAIASMYFGAAEPAIGFKRQALELNPAIESTAHRLLPDAPAAPASNQQGDT